MTKKNKFTAEFRREAASLVLDNSHTYREACDATGVDENILYRWVAQLRAERSGIMPPGMAVTPDQQRILELEERIRCLEMERDILKKAAALLITDEFKSLP
ncbi:transposase [Acerihabitans arboris]|uniref:Transposase n=1 Tax=Acerihabitans arboris TaxID=2691583 RepID=A0A845SMC6_9GAMM|nr:transposase [Acerihabitans arboris]NDL63771.1 transposase [Acerihabitans arboris]